MLLFLLYNVEAFRASIGVGAGERERNLIPTHADAEHIAEYLAEPLEVAPTPHFCARTRGAHAWQCRAGVPQHSTSMADLGQPGLFTCKRSRSKGRQSIRYQHYQRARNVA